MQAGLLGPAAPVVLVSVACGVAALVALVRRAYGPARLAAVGAVVAVVAGWGLAQYPWLLVDTLTIEAAAGARSSQTALLLVAGLAVLIVLPPLAYLLVLTQREQSWTEP